MSLFPSNIQLLCHVLMTGFIGYSWYLSRPDGEKKQQAGQSKANHVFYYLLLLAMGGDGWHHSLPGMNELFIHQF